jgi:hypothetical protein
VNEPDTPERGARMLLPCDGGPSISRLVTFPPPLEIVERDGVYVLVDDGPAAEWSYTFVPHEGSS